MTFPTDDADEKRFNEWLQTLDDLLESFDPGDIEPNAVVADILQRRAEHRPLFERVVELATTALQEFPRSSELLRRRGFALCQIVSDTLEHPRVDEGLDDLHTILAFDPDGGRAGLDLLNELFTLSGMDDSDVAEVADEIAERAQALMLEARVLQVRALVHADRMEDASSIAAQWLDLFPDHEELEEAVRELADPRTDKSRH